MKPTKIHNGFTLIEVMVVLSVLALMTILAYNFFGDTARESKNIQLATKIQGDLVKLDQAIELYEIRTGIAVNDLSTQLDDMIASGVIKAFPSEAPLEAVTGSAPYTVNFGSVDYNANGTNDDDLDLGNALVKDAVCMRYNEEFATGTIGRRIWAGPSAGGGDATDVPSVVTACYDTAAGADNNMIYYLRNAH